MPRILAGKPIIDALKEDGLKRVAVLKGRGIDPVLAIVRVGSRPDVLSFECTAF